MNANKKITERMNALHRQVSHILTLKGTYEDSGHAFDLIEKAQDAVEDSITHLRNARAALS